MNIGFQKVADVLKEKSNGRLRIDIFPTSQLGTGREMDQQVSDGTLEFTSDGPGILSAWVKTLSIFEAPFISRDWNHLVLMMNSDWGKAQFAELAKSKDMLLIGNPWYYGTRQTTTKERAVKTVADMKGLKIRVPGAAVPRHDPRPSRTRRWRWLVYLSLQTSVVDSGESIVDELLAETSFSSRKLRDALRELVGAGLATNDTIDAMRAVVRWRPLVSPRERSRPDPTRWLPADYSPSANRHVVQRRPNLHRLPRWQRPDVPGGDATGLRQVRGHLGQRRLPAVAELEVARGGRVAARPARPLRGLGRQRFDGGDSGGAGAAGRLARHRRAAVVDRGSRTPSFHLDGVLRCQRRDPRSQPRVDRSRGARLAPTDSVVLGTLR
jgi:hypothetical protein